ncbi:hypothetical protein L2E82_40536 [Cichorium intybus]|uniref:Uncharacterized protein n=1 Tax=Cichorium intybus TaxID=13427 RepID=A0ACB9AKI2_CICIN|nr:hypothetical protein L2E82_40536 [Cichorium intybus]
MTKGIVGYWCGGVIVVEAGSWWLLILSPLAGAVTCANTKSNYFGAKVVVFSQNVVILVLNLQEACLLFDVSLRSSDMISLTFNSRYANKSFISHILFLPFPPRAPAFVLFFGESLRKR